MKFYVPLDVAGGALADGSPLVPGTFVEIAKAQTEVPHNESLIAEGAILPTTRAGKNIAEEATENIVKGSDA